MMKKIKYTLLLALILGCIPESYAQEEVQDPNLVYKNLVKRNEKSDNDIQDPKKNIKSTTWIKRGQLLNEIYEVDQKFLGVGMGKERVTLFYKNPLEEKTEEVNGEMMNVMVYDRKKVFLKQNIVEDWIVTEMGAEEPLIKAYEAYKKALELDETGKLGEKMLEDIDNLRTNLEKEASMCFRRKEFEKSMNYFSYAFQTAELKPESKKSVDTANMYNAGLAASNAQLYEKSIEFFNKSKEYAYGGANLYILLKNSYMNLNDSTKILPLLKEGFEKYPQSKDIIVELINYYLSSNQAREALEYLKIAKDNDPENATYYFAEGTLYDKLGDFDKTVESYTAAINFNKTWFDPYYNMGVIYYNRAVEIFEEASKIPPKEVKKYDETMMKGNDELAKSLPFMEKALEIAENDFMENSQNPDVVKTYKGTLDTLKTIYFRLRNRSEEYQKKLDEIETKLGSF